MPCTEGRGFGGPAWMLAAALTLALAAAWDGPGARAAGSGDRIGSSEMDAFTAASREVMGLCRQSPRPVGRDVRQRMVEAVRSRGLSVSRYNEIARRIRQESGLFVQYREAWRTLGSD